MKNIFKTLAISFLMVIVFLISSPVLADPPGTPGGHGGDGDVSGGGVPIASGLAIIIALGGVYAAKKIYHSSLEE